MHRTVQPPTVLTRPRPPEMFRRLLTEVFRRLLARLDALANSDLVRCPHCDEPVPVATAVRLYVLDAARDVGCDAQEVIG